MDDKWERRYRKFGALEAAARVLLDNIHLLPASGQALDLACGISGNGILLAGQGLDTEVWDTADAALDLQLKLSRQLGVSLSARHRDCETCPPETDSFDVICVCHFLHREGCQQLVEALRPGGLLFYQTFHNYKAGESGPSSSEYLLRNNELLLLFKDLEVRYYREDGRCGKPELGDHKRAFFVGQKPNGDNQHD